MNAAVILASGVGNRFNDPVPKQYHLVRGRPVIEYAISACLDSNYADEVIVVARREYLESLKCKYGVTAIEGGSERNKSFRNALEYLKKRCSGCEKIVVVDAVNPLVTSAMIDKFFLFLDNYDIALTTSKIPTSLGCYDKKTVDRSRYYTIQNPQSYRFDMVYDNFDKDSPLTVIAQQMPDTARVKLCWDFKDFAKIIYPHDIAIVEALLNYRDQKKIFDCHKNDVALRFLADLRSNWPQETRIWEKGLNSDVMSLIKKWHITEYKINPASWKGLVFEGSSALYGEVVFKITPPYIGLFERNLHAFKRLPADCLVKLYDCDYDKGAILMERVIPGDYADFGKYKDQIIEYFETLYSDSKIELTEEDANKVPRYLNELKKRAELAANASFEQNRCSELLKLALRQYQALLNSGERLIHGDLHEGNLLVGEHGLIAIDPWAFIAVPQIEIACYAAYSVRNSSPKDRKNRLRELREGFSAIIPQKEFDSALFVEMSLLLMGAITGKNDDNQLAKLWLETIDAVFDELELIA